MMKGNQAKYIALAILLLVGSTAAQKFSFGACPTITAQQQTINLANFAITWFEYARTPLYFEHSLKCVTWNIAAITANVQYSVSIVGQTKSIFNNGAVVRIPAIFNVAGTVVGGVLTGGLSLEVNRGLIPKTPEVWVNIGSDVGNTQFIVLYSCRNIGLGRLENLVILTNVNNPGAAITTPALAAATAAGIPTYLLKKTNQIVC